MRITGELIQNSLSYLNPLKERELDLRGHKIPAIENLGAAMDHDALDLTDNDIPSLSNFPLSKRLRTLLVARNRVAHIAPALHESLPGLTTLVLAGNRVQELGDLDPLGGFARLTHLVLLENPVCRKENYRLYVIWRCPSVRFFDYRKVKDSERNEARKLFGAADQPTALATKISRAKSTHNFAQAAGQAGANGDGDGDGDGGRGADVPGGASGAGGGGAIRIKLTPEERQRVERIALRAKSEDEIKRLEILLEQGRVPGEELDV